MVPTPVAKKVPLNANVNEAGADVSLLPMTCQYRNCLIVAGEFPLGTVFPQAVEDRKKKGAKVDWVGVAPVIAKLGTIGLAAHASHPNAAKLYIDFCLSKEGQAVLVECERFPARSDMDVEKFRALKALKIYPSDFALADKFNTYSKQFAEVVKWKKSR